MKSSLSLDDKEASDAVSFLIRCLKESKKARHVRQQLWSVRPSTFNCNTFFGLYPTSTCRTERYRCEQTPAFHDHAASSVDPSANHFQTLIEFKERYGSYRKLKLLRRRESRLSSSTCLERTHKASLLPYFLMMTLVCVRYGNRHFYLQ
ncbi:hypothetical protein GCK32_017804 [Trichostrongylus colubriformis]|uniref:Uncharacterized protein n=1 Tax=Trichostrongylus colubriformis TaxID=6319 RepID=A0AAN8FGR9_TRICO